MGGHPLEFILAVPARRYGEFVSLLEVFHQQTCKPATEEVVGALVWQGFRLIVAHQPEVTKEQGDARDERIAALDADAARWAGKLDGQEAGQSYRGKKLSDLEANTLNGQTTRDLYVVLQSLTPLDWSRYSILGEHLEQDERAHQFHELIEFLGTTKYSTRLLTTRGEAQQ